MPILKTPRNLSNQDLSWSAGEAWPGDKIQSKITSWYFSKLHPVHCTCPSDIFEDFSAIFEMDHFCKSEVEKREVIFLKKAVFFIQKQWHLSHLPNPLRKPKSGEFMWYYIFFGVVRPWLDLDPAPGSKVRIFGTLLEFHVKKASSNLFIQHF